jgi:DNA-binding transcriptional regulator/RsmH inhibitor MraZ
VGTYRSVARFRYPLQVALDHARASERRGERLLVEALALLERERSARAELAALAVRARAELAERGSTVGGVYVEIGRRLTVLAAADRERAEREVRALAEADRAREALGELVARRTAIERHRDAARRRYDSARELRETAELEESNLLMPTGGGRSLWS